MHRLVLAIFIINLFQYHLVSLFKPCFNIFFCFQPNVAMKLSAERMKEIVMKIAIACLDSSVGKRRMPAQLQQREPSPMPVAAISVSTYQGGWCMIQLGIMARC